MLYFIKRSVKLYYHFAIVHQFCLRLIFLSEVTLINFVEKTFGILLQKDGPLSLMLTLESSHTLTHAQTKATSSTVVQDTIEKFGWVFEENILQK